MKLPEKGRTQTDVLRQMRERKKADADWRGGRTWSLIYPAGEEIDQLLQEAANLYLFENALNPFRFPSLAEMEKDVVDMTASLLHAPEGYSGAMSSGGTESILLAVKTARNRARVERGIDRPEIVAPVSAHPAFAKAAEVLGLELRQAPLAEDLRCDVEAAAKLMGPNTALVVGSAPNYPHGAIDPIPQLAALAAENGAAFHTDSCVGGFVLPFLEKMGYDVPPWDFRVDGVSTMSADVHKYGYTIKGASVILHRDGDSLMKHQAFFYDKWPGGIYGSLAMAGARPAAPIAAAWAIMNHLGTEGYIALAERLMKTTERLKDGIVSIPGLHIIGNPLMSVLAFGSKEADIMAVGDVMDDKGWGLDRQHGPDALHMMVSPAHDRIVDEFLADLRGAVEHHEASRGVEARYS